MVYCFQRFVVVVVVVVVSFISIDLISLLAHSVIEGWLRSPSVFVLTV